MKKDDIYFMNRALMQAEIAMKHDEVPVGAVIVKDGNVIARAYNRRESSKDPLAHAELLAIGKASKKLGSWRLSGCTLYVTLEPCPMCSGAIMNARIKRVVYGAKDPKAGTYGSIYDLNSYSVNHKPEVLGGIMKEECSSLLSGFFKRKR